MRSHSLIHEATTLLEEGQRPTKITNILWKISTDLRVETILGMWAWCTRVSPDVGDHGHKLEETGWWSHFRSHPRNDPSLLPLVNFLRAEIPPLPKFWEKEKDPHSHLRRTTLDGMMEIAHVFDFMRDLWNWFKGKSLSASSSREEMYQEYLRMFIILIQTKIFFTAVGEYKLSFEKSCEPKFSYEDVLHNWGISRFK